MNTVWICFYVYGNWVVILGQAAVGRIYSYMVCNGTQECALVYSCVCHPFRVDSITEVRREADRNRSEEPDSLCPMLWETVSFTLSFPPLPTSLLTIFFDSGLDMTYPIWCLLRTLVVSFRASVCALTHEEEEDYQRTAAIWWGRVAHEILLGNPHLGSRSSVRYVGVKQACQTEPAQNWTS